MTNSPESTTIKRTGLIITILNASMLLVAFGIVIWNGFGVFQEMIVDRDILYSEVVGFVSAIVYTVIGALIINRKPDHTVGWLFLIIGFGSALGSLATSTIVLWDTMFPQPILVLFRWTNSWSWILTFFILPSLVVLYFPDGRLPSRRWWPVLIAILVGIGGYIVHDALSPTYDVLGGQIVEIKNPFGIVADESFFTRLLAIAEPVLFMGIIGSLAAMFIRFRRSRGSERMQIKWLVFVVGLVMPIVMGLSFLPGEDNLILSLIFISLPLLMGATIGIAILRHQLFDIDLIIRRTLQYTILTGLLVLVYFGSVVLLQGLVEKLTGEQSPIVIVISTLAIAALFNPLRIRVQDFIDRRFYRKKYSAEQALAQFNATARDEVDMDRLTTSLLVVVKATIQPEWVSLWLRQER